MGYAQFEVEDLVTIPKTPEAAAFTEYANTASVSLYTGKASVAVPIDGLQGRNMSHPVSLTYMTGGIKVQQEAGIAGLGWNLNVGGMVTRNINGLPDDYIEAEDYYYPFYSDWYYQWPNGGAYNISDVYRYFRDNDYGVSFSGASLGKIYEGPYQPYQAGGWHELYRHYVNRVTNIRDIEIEPDSYTFSAAGISGTIVIDYDTSPVSAYCIEHPDYLVDVVFGTTGPSGEKPIEGWSIIDNQGTQYTFNLIEKTKIRGDGGFKNSQNGRTYASGWYLTQIYNPHAKDTYNFFYNAEYVTAEYGMQKHGEYINDRYAQGDDSDQICGTGSGPVDPGVIHYQYTKHHLSSVRVNNTIRLDLLYDDSRLDLSTESRLDGIIVYDVLGNYLNEYDFVYSYFGTPNTSSPRKDYISRLKLDEVIIMGDGTDTETQSYTFDYFGQSIPDRDSFAQDYWGYYNGHDDNQSLVPRNSQLDNAVEHTGNRSVHPGSMKVGTLKTVYYPTGGSTSFDFAANGYAGRSEIGYTESVGAFYLDGGADTSSDDPCDPQAGIEGAPFVEFDAMVIEETDMYTITISASGGSSDAVQGAAIKIGGFTQCDAVQSGDPESFDFIELNPDNFGSITKTLTPGKYKVMLINDQTDTRVVLSVTRQVGEDRIVTKPAGGLRVIGKQNFDETGKLVHNTVYDYRNVAGSETVASGVLHQGLRFEEVSHREQIVNNMPFQCESLVRYASNRNTTTPNVVTYTMVSELEIDQDGNPNGAVVYQFYNTPENVGDRPYYKYHMENGMVKDRWVYKIDQENNYQVLTSEHNDYEVKHLGGSVGYRFLSQASAFLDPMLHMKEDDPTQAKWVYAPMYFTSLGGSDGASSGSIELTVIRIDNLVNNGVETGVTNVVGGALIEGEPAEAQIPVGSYMIPCALDHSNGSSTLDNDGIIDAIADGLSSVAQSLHEWFNGSGTDINIQIDPNPLLIECFPVFSQTPIKYKQPYSIPRSWLRKVSSSSYQYEDGLAVSKNQSFIYDETPNTNQFQIKSVVSDYVHGKSESIHYYYALDSTSEQTGLQAMVTQNRVTIPFRVERKVDGVEKSLKKSIFDSEGRLLTVQMAHDSPEIEIGDLDAYLEDRMIVLEYHDEYNKVKKLKDETGLINYYQWGNSGKDLIVHLQTPFENFEAQLPAGGNGLDRFLGYYERFSSIPSSIVQVYEYDPGKGLIRQIDPNGRNTFYEYDSFGRLIKVIDHEGHVLSQNEYHFANQND